MFPATNTQNRATTGPGEPVRRRQRVLRQRLDRLEQLPVDLSLLSQHLIQRAVAVGVEDALVDLVDLALETALAGAQPIEHAALPEADVRHDVLDRPVAGDSRLAQALRVDLGHQRLPLGASRAHLLDQLSLGDAILHRICPFRPARTRRVGYPFDPTASKFLTGYKARTGYTIACGT